MDITYDPNKNVSNIQKHGLSFEEVRNLEWEEAYTWIDGRFDYSEERASALVPMGERLYFVAYTHRSGTMRIITFRKANYREFKRYERNH